MKVKVISLGPGVGGVASPGLVPGGVMPGVAPPGDQMSVRQIADAIRSVREQTTDARLIVREVMGLKEDLEPILAMFRKEEEPAPPPVEREGSPAPPDGVPAAARRESAPPPTEADIALREEVKALARRLNHRSISDSVQFWGPGILEAKKFKALADVLAEHGEDVDVFLARVPEEKLRAVAVELIDKRPQGDMEVLKGQLRAMLKEQDALTDAAAAAAPPDPPTDPSGGESAPVDAAKPRKVTKKKVGKKAVGA